MKFKKIPTQKIKFNMPEVNIDTSFEGDIEQLIKNTKLPNLLNIQIGTMITDLKNLPQQLTPKKKYCKGLCYGVVEDFIDEDFFIDFVEDTCNLDIKSTLSPIITYIKETLEKYPMGTIKRELSTKDWEYIYNFQTINYVKRIKYSKFKKIVQITPSLIQFLILQVKLYDYLSQIKEASKKLFGSYCNISEQDILKDLISLKVCANAETEDTDMVLITIGSVSDYYNRWRGEPFMVYNYWFPLWLMMTLYVNCMEAVPEILKVCKTAITDFNFAFGKIKKPYEINNGTESKKAHNAYTDEEKDQWYNCKQIYDICLKDYKLIQFIVKNKKHNMSYNKILKGIDNFNLDIVETQTYKVLVDKFFANDISNWFSVFKNYIDDNCKLSYYILFEKEQITTIDGLYKYTNKVKSRDFALLIVKSLFAITHEKSNKTILNKISDIEYEVKKNLFKPYDTERRMQQYKNLSTVEKIIVKLENIYSGFQKYFNYFYPTDNVFIRSNIEELELLLDELEKSQANMG